MHQDAEFASVGEENVEDCADGKYDNQDEVEEADGLQHLREALNSMHLILPKWCGDKFRQVLHSVSHVVLMERG